MKTLKKAIIVTTLSLIFSSQAFARAEKCYPDGCVSLWSHSETSEWWVEHFKTFNELLTFFSGAWGTGNATRDSAGNIIGMACGNGSNWQKINGCQNGATNYPACNQCPNNSQLTNNICVCSNGATPASQCQSCPTGLSMYNNICGCANGATNPTACNICPAGANMVSGTCVCGNNASPQSNCSSCPSGLVMDANVCRPGCDMTNVCGQPVQGITVNNTCTPPTGSNINSSCIQNFNITASTINPNGSVEFSWTIPKIAGVASRCGFVDLTTSTPRPIPGLQNLDATTDRTRISNIQNTTRFCLVCQFYKLLDNAVLGEAAVHQWVRVLRIGEN